MAEDAQRRAQRAPLPHNSLCRMGLKTNMKWLHSIRQDKRADREKSGSELAYNGARISLTFRQIGTFLSQDESKIWGQGATAKSRDGAKEVINGQREESVQLLRAFGAENNSSVFDWDAHYGKGFDVLHLQASPRLFASTDGVINMRIRLMLAEYGINYAKGSMGSGQESKTNSTIKHMAFGSPPVKYLDNNEGNAEVQGDMAIMLYLHSCHQKKKSSVPASDYASLFTMFQRALALLPAWRTAFRESEGNERTEKTKACLSEWDDTIRTSLRGMPFMGGEIPNLPDFAFWPVLHEIMETCGSDVVDHFANLKSYYHSMETRESTAKVLARDNVRPGCQ
jgi:glutathione S-transferase